MVTRSTGGQNPAQPGDFRRMVDARKNRYLD